LRNARIKRPRRLILGLIAGAAATVTALLVTTAGANQKTATPVTVSANHITAQALKSSPSVVDVSSLPNLPDAAVAKRPHQRLPLLTPLGSAGLKQAKANAAANAPAATRLIGGTPQGKATRTPDGALQGFEGMKDGDDVCPPFGCEPPDHGVATDGSLVLQVVNTALAIYDTKGKRKKQVDLIKFFKIPAPQPKGCDTIPFVSDPRAFYDSSTGRWVVAMLQVEGAFGVPCDFLSAYWVAVSKTSKPNGKWTIYSFNTANLVGSPSAADYTQLGFDSEAIFIGGNQFSADDPNPYLGAWTLAIPKAAAEAGDPIPSLNGFAGYTANDGSASRVLDTVQPVASYGAGAGGPAGEILVASFNESITESKLVVMDFSNALEGQGHGQTLSSVILDVDPYSLPPLADNYPGCTDCLETIDNRISATPVYLGGMVYATHDTAVDNGDATNANVHWFALKPVLDQTSVAGCTLCSTITGDTALVDQGYITYPGETDTWFGVIQPDREGNMFIAFDYGSSDPVGVSPSSAYLARRVTATDFPDMGQFLAIGGTDTFNDRWGDYQAVGFSGFDSNQIWFATEISDVTTAGDWTTHIDHANYSSLAQR
jgi:hypothetical protein